MKKIIIIFIIVFVLLGLGYYIVNNTNIFTNKVSIVFENNIMYPEFSYDKYEYTIYTKDDKINVKCNNFKEKECNKVINIREDDMKYKITHLGKEYVFNIHKVSKDHSFARIDKINGIPDNYTKEANIEVEVYDLLGIGGISYSFDNGKTWQKDNKIVIKENGIYNLIVKDYFNFKTEVKDININNVDSKGPIVEISKSYEDGSYVLNAYAMDSESGISDYSWSNNENTKSVKIKKDGEYKVVVKDEVGNETEKSINISSSNKNKKKLVAIFSANGSEKDYIESCETTKDSCKVKVPKIIRKDYTIIGWSLNKDARSSKINNNQVEISEDTTYYAITRSNDKEEILLHYQDKNASGKDTETVSCYKYNKDENCSFVAPNVSLKKGYELIGWSSDLGKTIPDYKTGDIITIKEGVNYYSITKNLNPLVANFYIIDNKAATLEKTTSSCYVYNGSSKGCEITAPKILAKKGYKGVGYTSKKDSITKEIDNNGKAYINSNSTYYTITSYPIKITFDKNTTFDSSMDSLFFSNIAAKELSFYSTTCDNYNNMGCYITESPLIISPGNEIYGFSKRKDGEIIDVFRELFKEDTILYARSFNAKYKGEFKVGVEKKLGNVYFEYSNDLASNTVKDITNYFDKLYSIYPQLFETHSKMMIAKKIFYNKYIDPQTAGLTVYYNNNNVYNTIFIGLNNTATDKIVLVHELSHAFDFYYRSKTGNSISEHNDLLKLYNLYKNKSDKPLRSYAYNNEKEFIAESIAYYYVEKHLNYSFRPNYEKPTTNEIKRLVDKYICIAKNNYNEGAEC